MSLPRLSQVGFVGRAVNHPSRSWRGATEPNTEVGAIHPKAVPVILTTEEVRETWLTAPTNEALSLQGLGRTARCRSWHGAEEGRVVQL